MSDPTYPLFPIISGFGFVLVLIPLPWHLHAWNSGTCFFMLWAALACLNLFINSIVWAGNALNPAPWWCEISIRIMMGASVGIPASSLCINRRLYHIARVQAVAINRPEKQRAVMLDALICVVFPLLFIALQYVVQGHRFNIYEDIGCFPALYNTLPTYFITYMAPVLLGLVSAVYCVLSLREFSARRAQFSQFLSSNKSLTVSRYFRLMALAMTDIVFTTPLAIFIIWLNATATPIGPWISWEDTHFGYSRVDQIPSVIWHMNHLVVISMELTRWLTPLCAFIFFGFFGFADEAQRHYRLLFAALTKHLGIQRRSVPSLSQVASIGCFRKPAPTVKISLPMYTSTSSTGFPLGDLKLSDSDTTCASTTIDSGLTTPTSSPWSKCDDEGSICSQQLQSDDQSSHTNNSRRSTM